MSQPPCNLTLTIWAGQTFQDVLTLQNPSGAPIDLTGYSAQMQARWDVQQPDPPFINWTSTGGQIVLGGTAGTITFAVPAATTAALTNPTTLPVPYPINDTLVWVYDMVLTSAGGVAERVIQGALVIYPAVTRP